MTTASDIKLQNGDKQSFTRDILDGKILPKYSPFQFSFQNNCNITKFMMCTDVCHRADCDLEHLEPTL